MSFAFLATTALILLLVVPPAGAANTRVSLSDFRWSQNPSIDLNESVTWDWIGPDLLHTVTGNGPGGRRIDSGLGQLGRAFTVAFDEPGQFEFQCVLHFNVRGTVTVSDQPGDPNSDPGPQPPLNADLEPPFLDEVRLARTSIGPHGKGTTLRFAVSERGVADVDYYRVVRRGKRFVRRYAGWSEWSTFIGYNAVPFARKSPTFRARPGRYVGLLRATDESKNTTAPVTLRFEIRAPRPKSKPKKRR